MGSLKTQWRTSSQRGHTSTSFKPQTGRLAPKITYLMLDLVVVGLLDAKYINSNLHTNNGLFHI
jgi:hypothetical protein